MFRLFCEAIRKGRLMKKNKQWIQITLIMVGVVILAFFIPGFLFRLQDGENLSHIRTEKRDVLDVAKLNLEYERDPGKRLMRFAATDQFYITSTDYTMTNENQSELNDIFDQVYNQEWFDIMMYSVDSSVWTEQCLKQFLKEPPSAAVWKKYIICGNNIDDGVIIMAWYAEFTTAEGGRMEVLMDSETQTIYYLELSSPLGKEAYRMPSEDEAFYSFIENVRYYIDYYYASQIESANLEIQATDATQINLYDSQDDISYYIYPIDQENGNILDGIKGTFPIVYSGSEADNPQFQVKLLYNEKDVPTMTISMGFSKMEDYIPELSEEK